MATCPACRHTVLETAPLECPFCGVIIGKWKSPASALPEESLEPPVTNVLKPCPECGPELAGALVMEQCCPYCSARLPDGFDPRPEPPAPPPPLPPTAEELEFAALPFWKKLWKIAWHQHPCVAFLLSLVLLGFNLIMFCVGDHQMLGKLSVPMIVVMAAVAPVVAMGACSPYNLPMSSSLIGLCVVTFWRGWGKRHGNATLGQRCSGSSL